VGDEVLPGRRGGARRPEDPVGAHPARHDDRQAGEQERRPGHVVAGVEDDADVRIAGCLVTGLAQPVDHLTDLPAPAAVGSPSGPGPTASGNAV